MVSYSWYIVITYTYTGAIPATGYYVTYDKGFGIIDLNCTGNENSIWDCPYNGTANFYYCSSSHDASVICQGNKHFIVALVMMSLIRYYCSILNLSNW